MTGKELKAKLDKLGVNYAEMANSIGLNNRQTLNQKFNSKDITVSLLVKIAEYVNKNVYFFIGTKPPEMRLLNDPQAPYGKENEEIERLNKVIDNLNNQIVKLKNKSTVNSVQEIPPIVEAKLYALLEGLIDVASGKQFRSKEEAAAALGKAFYIDTVKS